jgi:hypothetical protein
MRSVRGVNEILIKGQPVPPADYKVQLMSLPGLFGLELHEVGVKGAYIQASSEKANKWAPEMAHHRQSLGIVWRGSPNHLNDKNRSIPLENFLTKIPKDKRYLSLQLGTSALEKEILKRYGVTEVQAEICDFEDTAAICQNMAGVVCVDTSVAHLCGALNVPCEVLLDVNPDWRWKLREMKSHWYGSINLNRQSEK